MPGVNVRLDNARAGAAVTGMDRLGLGPRPSADGPVMCTRAVSGLCAFLPMY